ncbi:hypothetical protein V5037_11760 [Enterobacter ludwigii]|jgi:hypothetical protein|uniref:hypothetical protein n=1 Tax=Enterobacter ludwigii TaxID=299767 RepID=UPI0030766018|nr:hypothetical protein [Klebsiella sp. T2.Ur]
MRPARSCRAGNSQYRHYTCGKRPFRVDIDPTDESAAVVNAIAERIRQQFLQLACR